MMADDAYQAQRAKEIAMAEENERWAKLEIEKIIKESGFASDIEFSVRKIPVRVEWTTMTYPVKDFK